MRDFAAEKLIRQLSSETTVVYFNKLSDCSETILRIAERSDEIATSSELRNLVPAGNRRNQRPCR